MKIIKRTVVNAKVITAFLMHLYVVGIRETKKLVTEKLLKGELCPSCYIIVLALR